MKIYLILSLLALLCLSQGQEVFTPEEWGNIGTGTGTGTGTEEETETIPIESEEEEVSTQSGFPPIEFQNGEESIVDTLQVDGKTFWDTALLDDVNVDNLATDLTTSQNAAVQDRALNNFVNDKLGGTSTTNQVINLGTSNNPPTPQAQNIKVANLNRDVLVSNWTGIPAKSIGQTPQLPTSLTSTNLAFILNAAASLGISQGIEAALLSSTAYTITAIDNVSQQGSTVYQVELQLTNNQNLAVNASFVIGFQSASNAWLALSWTYQFFQNNTQNLVVVSWTNSTGSFNIKTNAGTITLNEAQYLTLGGYSLVPNISTYVQPDKLRYLMIAGMNWVLSQGISTGVLKSDTYDVGQVHSVYVREDASGSDVLFRFDIDLVISNTTSGARVNFEVFYALEAQVQTYGFLYSI